MLESGSIFDRERYYFHNLYTGGELIISTTLGSSGAFAGYYTNFSNSDLFEAMGDRPLRFGTIPVLNISKYPVLKYLLSTIQNYLSFDFNESKINIYGSCTKVISNLFILEI